MPALQLTRAYIDAIKIHDAADAANPYTVRYARLTRPPRRDVTPRSQQHGSRNRTRHVDGAIFDLEGFVRGSTDAARATAFDDLEGVLYDYDTEHVFRFLREGRVEEERSLVRLAGLDAPAQADFPVIRYALTLEAEDPRIYSNSLRSGLYDPTESLSGGGTAIPLVFPLVFTTTTTTHLEVTNDGKWDSPPLFTIKGPVGYPIVDNDTIAKSIAVLFELGTNDTVEIDVAARTVKLNGALRRDLYDPKQSNWFELVPGTNRLRLRGSGMAADVSELKVEYRDAR